MASLINLYLNNMPEEIYQLGAVAIICLFLIKEMFAFLRIRNLKNGNQHFVKDLEDNHLNGIKSQLNNLEYMSREADIKMEKIINLLVEIKEKLK